MKALDIVLKSRKYRGTATPPLLTFEDASRWRNNGTHTAITWVRLPSGLWVRSFNGATSLVNCGSLPSLDDVRLLTWKAWIYPIGWGANNQGAMFSKNRRHFNLNTTGAVDRLRFFQEFDGTGGTWATPIGSIVLSRWYMVVVTYDFSLVANNPSMYINGAPQVCTPPIVTPVGTAVSDAADDLYIGNNPANTMFFDGYIALPEMWRYLASAGQVAIMFEKERHWFGV